MYTVGPAMSFFTSFCDLPQKEQVSEESRLSTGHAVVTPYLAVLLGLLADEHLVDEAVGLGLLGAHEVVALGVLLDLLDRLAGVLGEQPVQVVAGLEQLAGVDLDLGAWP
jgi:hypothetical protein